MTLPRMVTFHSDLWRPDEKSKRYPLQALPTGSSDECTSKSEQTCMHTDTVYVGDLSEVHTHEALIKHFSQYGEITKACTQQQWEVDLGPVYPYRKWSSVIPYMHQHKQHDDPANVQVLQFLMFCGD